MPKPEAKTNLITFDFKKVVEWALKEKGIHEGIWGLYARFGLQVVNAPVQASEDAPTHIKPTVVCPLLELGIQPYKEVNDLSVDAGTLQGRQSKKARSGKGRPKLKK
jgi:hypothetical protein